MKRALIQYYRSLESQLFNKANEIQEEISVKRFDQGVGQLHLAAIKKQVSKSAPLGDLTEVLKLN